MKSRREPKRDAPLPFDIDEMIRRLRVAVAPFPKAMLFELALRGYKSVFAQTIACMISVRTLDEISLESSLRLFALGASPAEVARLSVDEIDRAIAPAVFHYQKAERIHRIAHIAVSNGGEIACELETLLALPGIGPKCANLVLGISCAKGSIGVDIHVHRITNRWGYVETRTPLQTQEALEDRLPKKYWLEINALLVLFGKHICTRLSPKCPACPLLPYCHYGTLRVAAMATPH